MEMLWVLSSASGFHQIRPLFVKDHLHGLENFPELNLMSFVGVLRFAQDFASRLRRRESG
jgi:hypothetical protein